MYARLRCGGNLPQCLAFGTGEGHLWYGMDIRCQKQASLVRDASSKARKQPTPQTVDSPLPTGHIFSARNGPRSEVSRLKRGCIPWKCLRIHPRFS